MKFADLQARLAIAPLDPASEHFELLRSLREGSRGLAAEERKFARMATDQGASPIAWGPRGFTNLMRGRSGPSWQAGFEADPISVAAYLVAYLLDDCPHREVALRALEMSYLGLREVWRQTVKMPLAEMREEKVCPTTGQHFFLSAFAAVLADASLSAQCIDVAVCSALGVAYLDFSVDQQARPWPRTRTRSVFCSRDYDPEATAFQRVSHLELRHLVDLLLLIRSPAARPARAARKSRAKVLA